MELAARTLQRVLDAWRAWASGAVVPNTASFVSIGRERFSLVPERLGDRIGREVPRNLDVLLAALADELVVASGEAHLSYADAGSFRAVATSGATELVDDDSQLEALRRSADATEWDEALGGHAWDFQCGVTRRDRLVAVAGVRIWAGQFGQLGVFVVPGARGRGLGSAVASFATERVLTMGLVPQWRSRVGNEESLAVAEKLGFVRTGVQMFARIAPRSVATTRTRIATPAVPASRVPARRGRRRPHVDAASWPMTLSECDEVRPRTS